jgi:tetratricopeptide (TPR) repeat protein
MAPALDALGRHDEAIAAYRRYIELEPKSMMVPVAEAYIALIEKKKSSGTGEPLTAEP